VPSYSLINNLGFGTLNAINTHTVEIPKWYLKIKLANKTETYTGRLLQQDFKKDNIFFNTFYSDYTNNKIKLMLTLIKNYMSYLKQLAF
jgi:hypothetical protein